MGVKTSVSIDRAFKYKLAYPYSECTIDDTNGYVDLKDPELFNLIYYSEFGYEQQMCISEF